MGIFDIVLIVIALLALIIGLVKGGAGIFLGFIGTLVIAVVVAVGTVFIVPQFAYKNPDVGFTANAEDRNGCSDLFYSLYEPISSSFVNQDNILLNAQYTSDEGVIYGPFGEEGTNVEITLQEGLTTALPIEGVSEALGGVFGVVAGFISSGASEGVTVGQAISNLITRFAFGAIIWFVLFLVLFIIKRIIRRALFNALDTHPIASKIDRAIGAVILVAVVIVIAWVGVSYIDSNKESFGLTDNLESLYNENFTYKLFADHSMFGAPAEPANPVPVTPSPEAPVGA